MAPPRILIADDDLSCSSAVQLLLERAGFVTSVAPDGGTALRMLLEDLFDLTLLDVHMPELTGIEVLRQLRAHSRPVPSILMTGHPSRAIEAAALELGALSLLTKPIQPPVLRLTIEQVVISRPDPGSGN